MLKVTGHDNAILGVVKRFGQEDILCYSKEVIIGNLMKDMSFEEALEFFDYNILGAYVGGSTPCFI